MERTGTVEQCMKRYQDRTLTGSADLHENRTDNVNSHNLPNLWIANEGSGSWSKHLVGDQTGNREQGTGNREQGTGNRQGTGRQAGNRVVEGIA